MAITRYCSVAVTAAAISTLFLGCGDTAEKAIQPSSAEAPPAQASASSTATLELTDNSLSAYERGMKKEIEAVRAAQARSRDAKTAQERGEAIQAAFEEATIPEGAAAAGLPVEQYRALRATVGEIFRTLDFQGKIDGPLSMDLSRADAATKERLSRDPLADLSPASAAALRNQMGRLVPVWIEYVSMTAVAG